MITGVNLSKKFEDTGLSKTDITVNEGEFVVLSGHSGCGKSTLLNILTGMLSPDTGTVTINGEDLYKLPEKKRAKLRRNVTGYMMQKNSLIPELTVLQNILFSSGLKGSAEDRKKAEDIAESLHIADRLDAYPGELSGGEYRRAVLARVLMLDTPVIVADEPTSNLDMESAGVVRTILTGLNREGKTLIVATHDQMLIDCSEKVIAV